MEDKEIYIHPIFLDLLNNFRFFLVGINMMSMIDFQKALIDGHKGNKSEIGVSAEYDNFKCIKYDVRDVFSVFNREINLQKEGDKVKGDIKKLINFQARQIAVSLFDILQNSTFSKIVNQAEIFKFAKHIRNGAAHNNKFIFSKPLKSTVKWRNKIIDNSLQGTEVFDQFLSPGDLVLLISDISQVIKSKNI